jgi:hypothetical protein
MMIGKCKVGCADPAIHGFWGVLAAQFCLGAQVAVIYSPTHEFKLEFNPDAQVLYYRQIHNTEDLTREQMSSVLVSQFALISFLKANPHYEVFAYGTRAGLPQELDPLTPILALGQKKQGMILNAAVIVGEFIGERRIR